MRRMLLIIAALTTIGMFANTASADHYRRGGHSRHIQTHRSYHYHYRPPIYGCPPYRSQYIYRHHVYGVPRYHSQFRHPYAYRPSFGVHTRNFSFHYGF